MNLFFVFFVCLVGTFCALALVSVNDEPPAGLVAMALASAFSASVTAFLFLLLS